jgi:hypothetical protein
VLSGYCATSLGSAGMKPPAWNLLCGRGNEREHEPDLLP